MLGNIHDLLQPFAQYTSLVSGEDYTTISILPIIMELTLHLEEMKQIPELSRGCKYFSHYIKAAVLEVYKSQ